MDSKLSDHDVYEIVVHIIRGQFFPKFPGGIVAECTFRGNHQTTSPTFQDKLKNEVQWNQIFTFQLKHKILVRLRAQRDPIKIIFYGVDVHNRQVLGAYLLCVTDRFYIVVL
jgi:hypothetical protein